MKKVTQRIALIAMMLVLAVGAAMAQPDGEGRGPGDHRGPGKGEGYDRGQGTNQLLLRCLGTLDLTDEQKQQVRRLNARLENLEQTTRTELEALHQRLLAAREAGDRALAERIMAAIKEKQEALMNARKAVNDAILDLLTDAQKAALRDCMGGRKDDRGRGGNERNDCFSQLELTDAQMAEIRALREAHKAAHRAAMEEIRGLHKDVRDARKAGDADLVASLRAEIATKMEAIKAAQEELRQDILDVLTPEQLAELEDCMDDDDDADGRGVPNRERAMPQLN
jgi:Spy/CpxP family protein refolding chaperone